MFKVSKNVSLNLPLMLLLIAYGFVSLAQLQRVQLSHNVAFYAHDVFVSLFVAITFLFYRRQAVHKLKTMMENNPAWQWLFYFFAWALLGLGLNQILLGFSYVPWLYWLRLMIYLATGFLMHLVKSEEKQNHQWLAVFFTLVMGLFISIGLLQYFLIPDLRFISEYGRDVHYFRLAGSLLDPNFLGMILVNGLLVWLFALAKNNTWRTGVGLVFVLALLLTYSRSSYGAFFLVSMMYFLLKFRDQITAKVSKSLLILCLVFVVSLPFLPKPGGLGVELKRTETLDSRVEVNKTILENIQVEDLVMGRGLFVPTINVDVTDRIVHAHFPDNILVFVLISTGIPGLILFLGFVYQIMLKYFTEDGLKLLLFTGTLAHSMFNLTILEPINLLVLLLALQV